jgi:transcriptional regulator of acetoin/glycerol metabolism
LPAAVAHLSQTLADGRLAQVRTVLAECQGNMSEAARRLAVSRSTLYRLLARES